MDAINGAFMLLRRSAVDNVGLLDEQYWMYGEDLDWCYRFWARGWKVLYWPCVNGSPRQGRRDRAEAFAAHERSLSPLHVDLLPQTLRAAQQSWSQRSRLARSVAEVRGLGCRQRRRSGSGSAEDPIGTFRLAKRQRLGSASVATPEPSAELQQLCGYAPQTG